MSEKLISINQAAAQGIERVRLPVWKNQFNHLKIDVINGKPGPWTRLYSPMNKGLGNKEPVGMLFIIVNYDAKDYLPYNGDLPDSEAYKAEEAHFVEAFKRQDTK
ncbi:MAG: hypothetical protein V4451_16255 [Pseudomonadota bacterium]